jgi:hypothetical protein
LAEVLREGKLTGKIIILLVILIQHRRRDVRHIAPRVTLTSHEDLEVLDSKRLLEILEELDEVLRRLLL